MASDVMSIKNSRITTSQNERVEFSSLIQISSETLLIYTCQKPAETGSNVIGQSNLLDKSLILTCSFSFIPENFTVYSKKTVLVQEEVNQITNILQEKISRGIVLLFNERKDCQCDRIKSKQD